MQTLNKNLLIPDRKAVTNDEIRSFKNGIYFFHFSFSKKNKKKNQIGHCKIKETSAKQEEANITMTKLHPVQKSIFLQTLYC